MNRVVTSLIALFGVFSLSAQIDINQLAGNWAVKEVKQAPKSKKNIPKEDLDLALESLSEGYYNFSNNSIVFVAYDGDLEEDMMSATGYTYNAPGKEIKVHDLEDNSHIETMKIVTLTASKFVAQVEFDNMLVEYHFVKATPQQLLCGKWLMQKVTIDDYINSLPTNEKYIGRELETALNEAFQEFYMELYPSGTGYSEYPDEDGTFNEANFSWNYASNNLKMTYEDGSSEFMELTFVKHGQFQFIIPGEEFKMVITMTRL